MLKENNKLTSYKVNPDIIEIIVLLFAIFLVYLTSLYDYLLFHSIAEIFSIVIAGGVFLVGWHSRKYMESSFFLILGVSSLFIAVIDLIHTLAYPGMPIFEDYSANLATSLWIAARYFQTGSFLFALLLIKKRVKPHYLISTYIIISLILIILIFINLFPICYIAGFGLTPFKIVSEYIIDLILLGSLYILIKNRAEFDKKVYSLMICSILATMVSEIAFTFYFGVYEFPNLIGHIFKIIAFYFLYKSIVQIGIEEPFNLLFRKIRRNTLELENIIKHSGAGITLLDKNGTYLLVNEKAARELGGNPIDFIGKTLNDVFPEDIAQEYLNSIRELIENEISRSYQRTFDLPMGQKTFWILEQPIKDVDERNSSLLSVATDISEKIKSEEMIREAEERYRMIFEQSPDGVVIFDIHNFTAVDFNDSICNILGYTREEFKKLQIKEYDAMENPSEIKFHAEKVLNEGRDDFETKFRTKNGEIKDIYVIAKVIELSGHKYLQSICRDITEQKKSEEIKTKLAAIVESSEDAIISKNLDGIITSWNRGAQKIYYYTAEEMVGKSIEFLAPPDHDCEIPEILGRINRGEKLEGFETERVRKDGSKVDVSLTVSPIKDMNGKIIGTSVIARDVTERKKAEEKIHYLSKFPSENPNPVLRVNSQRVLYSNKIAMKLFNTFEDAPLPKVLEKLVIEAIDNEKIVDYEINLNSRTYTLIVTPVKNVDYVNIYGMDITERKKAEERLSQLISTVSHELRTPITVLLMSIEYLTKNKENLNDDLEEKLMDGISRNVQLLNQLAEDILLISRIDEKGLILEWKEYSPFEIINEILYLMKPIGKEKNIYFEINIDKHLWLIGDPKRIDQIFRIIIDNSIKYSDENSKVEIRSINNYQGKYNFNGSQGVLFQFIDNGRGISKEDLPHIFERFFRASNVSEIAGTGLGLAIAKNLIEAHKGSIFVDSELEKGTIFHLFLPKINI